MEKFYTGVNIETLKNKKVEILDRTDWCGTNLNVPVYNCKDEKGKIYKIAETNLSDSPVNYNYMYGGVGECFPKNVKRFHSFKGKRYIGDWEHVGD